RVTSTAMTRLLNIHIWMLPAANRPRYCSRVKPLSGTRAGGSATASPSVLKEVISAHTMGASHSAARAASADMAAIRGPRPPPSIRSRRLARSRAASARRAERMLCAAMSALSPRADPQLEGGDAEDEGQEEVGDGGAVSEPVAGEPHVVDVEQQRAGRLARAAPGQQVDLVEDLQRGQQGGLPADHRAEPGALPRAVTLLRGGAARCGGCPFHDRRSPIRAIAPQVSAA